ncbi:TrbI/VirB10 family protein [Calothrix sp. 336/3]|uniref:TrbI/VirB10 family protein n=1 Tax=Calothrix sp. 336/3 TaxID=1337936 RepID=UPI0004E46B19|nr:TrbI/VirB10 family protein [Calothrix sp. 336/3]AKG19982.1 hypothetical protein IJ00_00430 [Calothrix sp. 336/3]
MTSYSLPSENSNNHLPFQNHKSENSGSDWESQMARLVGFEDESRTQTVAATPVNEETANTPEVSSEKQPLSANPFAKLSLVGGGTLMMVLLAGGFLSQLMSVGRQKPKVENNLLTAKPVNTQPATANLETEIETLKTKLALTEQTEAVKLAQQRLRTNRLITVARSPVISARQASFNPITRTAPQRTVYISQPAPANPVARVPYAPPIPVNTAIAPPIQPPMQPPMVNPVTPKPDPLQEWNRLAKLGSYGLVSATPAPAPTLAANPPTPPQPTPPQSTPPEPTNTQFNAVVSQASEQQSPKSVAVGMTAKAVLATAVFGETSRGNENKDDDEGKTSFVVRLKEPLKSLDGEIALPEKSELLVEIRSLSEQGLLQLTVTKVIIPNKGNPIEKTLPKNALIVRAPEGRPLIADQFPNKSGSIASMDLGLFVLGGIGKAAELFNRTESQVVTTTTSGTIVTNTNPKRNILAGIVEGGVTSVVPQISQRNQQAITQMIQRTNIWFLKAGTKVEVYVNQSMQF